MPTSNHPNHHRPAEQGQSLVETALVLPVLLLLVLGALQVGALVGTWQQLSSATSEGARRAIVSATNGGRSGAVVSAVHAAAPILNQGQLGVSVSSSWQVGAPVTVTATYPFTVRVMGHTFYSGSLTSSRTMMVAN